MKAKTINKIICNKFDSFVKSIKDESVQKLVKYNSIITGGCIASMLLNEDVNDYDIYFTNHETTLAVANYYVDLFKKSGKGKIKLYNKLEVDICVTEEDGKIAVKVKSAGIVGDINEDTEYKYYETTDPGSPESENFVDKLITSASDSTKAKQHEYKPVFLSSNAITLSDNVQLILRFYGNAEEIHKNYDFVHCTNYWESSNRKLTLHRDALLSLMEKDLKYQGSLYPVSSIIRTRKFINRGWTCNAGQYLKMMFQVNDLNLKDSKVLADQLTGVDVAYFHELLRCIEKDNPKEIDSIYISEVIDKIF